MSVSTRWTKGVVARRDPVLGLVQAGAELGLNPSDMELAVLLGEVRTAVDPQAAGSSVAGHVPWGECRVVARAELDRMQAEEGAVDGLRNRLRLVGTGAGAELIGIGRDRFGKLAKAGCFRAVRWYVNRYRAVVWLYPATEVAAFAASHKELLTGRLPAQLRARIGSGGDLRARGWRARVVQRLIADAQDAWQEAAVWAALLGPEEAGRIVLEPELARLRVLLPALPPGRPGMYAGRDVIDAQLVADDPEEVTFGRLSLGHALERAGAGRSQSWTAGTEAVPEVPMCRAERVVAPGAEVSATPVAETSAALRPADLSGRTPSRGLWRRVLRGAAGGYPRTRGSTGRAGPVA